MNKMLSASIALALAPLIANADSLWNFIPFTSDAKPASASATFFTYKNANDQIVFQDTGGTIDTRGTFVVGEPDGMLPISTATLSNTRGTFLPANTPGAQRIPFGQLGIGTVTSMDPFGRTFRQQWNALLGSTTPTPLDGTGYAIYNTPTLRDPSGLMTDPNIETLRAGFQLPTVKQTLRDATTAPGVPSNWTGIGQTNYFEANAGTFHATAHDLQVRGIDPAKIQSLNTLNQDGSVDITTQRVITALAYTTDPLSVFGTLAPPGAVDNPLLPQPAPPGDPLQKFLFHLHIEKSTGIIYFDPAAATGYEFILDSGPKITAVTLPNVGDGLYDLFLFNDLTHQYEKQQGQLMHDVRFAFAAGGVSKFKIEGIETGAIPDASDPLAFKTGLEFSGAGDISLQQIPQTATVPLPGAAWLLGSALLVLRRRRAA